MFTWGKRTGSCFPAWRRVLWQEDWLCLMEALLSISGWCCFTVECVAGLGVEGPQLKLKCCVE